MVPFESLPVPEKLTLSPVFIVTLLLGEVMEAVGIGFGTGAVLTFTAAVLVTLPPVLLQTKV